ncbi:uncharacterized protein TrAFT101_010324 [Trichoderma asperellum]|nr:hypothetical protein TrAFT101_010324 [Trichoderma asperellum]
MMFPVEVLKLSYFSTAADQALVYLSSFRSANHLQTFGRLISLFAFVLVLFLLLSFIMQLGAPLETPEVAALLHHGGTNYIELIKTNLQFLYGRDVPIEILSQVTPPDTWQITVLKTEDGVRTVAIAESGQGLTNALKQAHYQSGQLLAEFACDPTKDNSTLGRREELQIEIATSVANFATGRNDDNKDGKAAEKAPEDPVWQAAFDNARRMMGPNNGDPPRMLAADIRWVNELNRKKLDEFYAKRPDLIPAGVKDFRPTYTLLPEPAESGHPHSAGDSWHNRPRTIADQDIQVTGTTAREAKAAPSAAAESSAQGAASAAAAPISPREEASKSYKEALMERMHSQAAARRMAPNKQRHGIVLYIHLSGCGEAVVADECQLSVKAVESRVRYLMRMHGRALFGEANASKMPAIMFTPGNATKYNVLVKGMRVGDAVAILGPQFGDDLEAMAESVQAERPVKLQIELLWNGEYIPGLDRAALSPTAAVTAKAAEASKAAADAAAAATAGVAEAEAAS